MRENKKYIINKTAKYKIPCLITLSGLPGSGKTVCAKVLSKNLKVFIVSNDFIRSSCINDNQKIIDEKTREIQNKKVLLMNAKRLLQLFSNRVSVVLDSDSNDIEKFKKIELLTKFFRYQIIKIKINSVSDSVNLSRIKKRKDEDTRILDSGIIGDKISSFCHSEQTYYDIKSRKPQLLDDNFFDYVLNNDGDLDKYINEINNISEEIISKRLTLK
ncbi:MAG: AAA family ATPase [Bacilli bacterium]|nr:AAA family ATPase [Bacilli bacterium]